MQTLVVAKPRAVAMGVKTVVAALHLYKAADLELRDEVPFRFSTPMAERFYFLHEGKKETFQKLVLDMTSGESIAWRFDGGSNNRRDVVRVAWDLSGPLFHASETFIRTSWEWDIVQQAAGMKPVVPEFDFALERARLKHDEYYFDWTPADGARPPRP